MANHPSKSISVEYSRDAARALLELKRSAHSLGRRYQSLFLSALGTTALV